MSSFWLTLKQQWTIKISSPLFSIFSLAAILVGSRDHRTQFWKGAIQGPFHQSLVAIGPVVSEEKIKMWKVDGRTTDEKWWQYGQESWKGAFFPKLFIETFCIENFRKRLLPIIDTVYLKCFWKMAEIKPP